MSIPAVRLERLVSGRPLASDRLEHERLNKKTALGVGAAAPAESAA